MVRLGANSRKQLQITNLCEKSYSSVGWRSRKSKQDKSKNKCGLISVYEEYYVRGDKIAQLVHCNDVPNTA